MSGSHAGRPSSWLAVVVMVIGFTVGGVALCLGPNWIGFWFGSAIVVLGGVLGLAVGILSDVVLDEPRVKPEVVEYSVAGDEGSKRRGGTHGETIDKPTKTDPQETPHG